MFTTKIKSMSRFKRLVLVLGLEALPFLILASVYTLFFDESAKTMKLKVFFELLMVIWYVFMVLGMALIAKNPKGAELETIVLDNDNLGRNLMALDKLARYKAKRRKKIEVGDTIRYTQKYILNRWISDPIDIKVEANKLFVTLPSAYLKTLDLT